MSKSAEEYRDIILGLIKSYKLSFPEESKSLMNIEQEINDSQLSKDKIRIILEILKGFSENRISSEHVKEPRIDDKVLLNRSVKEDDIIVGLINWIIDIMER